MPANSDALEVCRDCGGTGWVASADDPNRVARCSCRRRSNVDRLLRDAGLPPRYHACTLQQFSTSHPDPVCRAQLLRAVSVCRRYIDDFLSDREDLRFRDSGLLLTGPYGSGKTHLAVATLRELIATYRVRGRFVDFTSLVQDLQSAIDPDAPFSRNELLAPVENAEVLVVDELGAQTLRPWAADVLYDLINRRYARRLPTLFTTNYKLDDPAARNEAPTADRAAAELEAAGRESGGRGRDSTMGGSSLLSRRIPGMLVSRLWEMAQVVSLDAVKDYRMEVCSHQHGV